MNSLQYFSLIAPLLVTLLRSLMKKTTKNLNVNSKFN